MTKKFRNKKKYYNNQKQSIFKDGQSFKGILITCPNVKERFAVRDSYRFLNDIYEKKFNKNLDELEEEAIEQHLKNNLEQEQQKEEEIKKTNKKYFAQQIKIKGKGLVFIKLDQKYLPENCLISNFIDEFIQKAQETQQVISRSIFRILPIEVACQANISNFQLFMQQLIDKFFDPKCDQKKTWSFIYKCRNNSKFQKNQFLDFIKDKIPANYGFYDYKGDLHVIVDITSSFMCLSILPNYNKLNRYSLVQSNKDEIDNKSKQDEKIEEKIVKEEILDTNINNDIDLIQLNFTDIFYKQFQFFLQKT